MSGTPGFVALAPSGTDLFAYLANGEAMLRMLLVCEPGSVAASAIERAAKAKSKSGMSAFANTEALQAFLTAAKGAGMEVTSLGATDFVKAEVEHKEHLVLGLLWQMLRRQLANEIKAILQKQEADREARGVKSADFESLMARVLRDPEAYLLDWVNATLKSSNVGVGWGGVCKIAPRFAPCSPPRPPCRPCPLAPSPRAPSRSSQCPTRTPLCGCCRHWRPLRPPPRPSTLQRRRCARARCLSGRRCTTSCP